eukprot:CAMPEP_0119417382 /NCGR_PEP_ID=MMETSP1335-20130426/15632_1 /TAXON_ID=259385 /ORGANISM="Chrysoculter rhomboideus, Strain RCC1486" /LENGTH=329 /DNA_ID=CAMNT_0007442555 /DNA_START=1 /DNA_END=990 /DNA_ORIENTATION=+
MGIAFPLAFGSLELIAVTYLSWRTLRARQGSSGAANIAYAQRWILPLFASAFLIEVLEAVLWAGEPRRIGEAEHEGCTRGNAALTRLAYVVLCAQPLLIVTAARHTGYSTNMLLLKVPEAISLVYGAVCLGALLRSELGGNVELLSLASSNVSSDRGLATCTYVSEHGYLHSVFRQGAGYPMPCGVGYFVLALGTLWARPWWVASGLLGVYLGVYTLLHMAIGFSAISGPIWSWSPAGGLVFLIAQPRLFAHHAEAEGFPAAHAGATDGVPAGAGARTQADGARERADAVGSPGQASSVNDDKSASGSSVTDIHYYDEAYRTGQVRELI